MKTLFFFVFCTFSVWAQAEPKVIIFYEYTADGYALFAANDEEYPVTLQFDFDLLNLKVVRDGPSSIVVPAEANKHKLLDLVAINVLKGYSFEYTFTVKKGAVKANLKDIITVSDRAAAKAKELSKNVDTTDEPVVSSANRNPRDLRESRITRKASSKPETVVETKSITSASEPLATAKTTEVKLDSNNKPIAKTEPTQVAIAKAVKKKEREERKKAKMERAKNAPIAVTKTEPAKTAAASTMIETKEAIKKTVAPVTTAEPIAKTKPEPMVVPKVENTSTEVAIAKPTKKKRTKKKREKKKPANENSVVLAKTESAKTVVASKTIEVKKPVVKTEPAKTVVASTTITEKESAAKKVVPVTKAEPMAKTKPDQEILPKAKNSSTQVATTKPIKKEQTKKRPVKKKKSKKKPVVVAAKPVVVSKSVKTMKAVVAKEEVAKPAVTVTTPKKEPVAKIDSPKKEEAKPVYAKTGKYDAAFQYHLPFSKGATYKISQGYQGSISHQSKFALDFEMPSGTTIYSSREGTVLEVVENNSQGCATQDCAKYDNFIVINHPDGSFAKYAHIRTDGALVSEGDVIKEGQLIGYSGNTGWTGAPALHFEVFVQKEKEQKTIKTNFLTGDGSDYGILMEQRRYKKEY